MILGTLGPGVRPASPGEWLEGWCVGAPADEVRLLEGPGFRVGVVFDGSPAVDRRLSAHLDPETGLAAVIQGELFEGAGIADRWRRPPDVTLERVLGEAYREQGAFVFAGLNGGFAAVVCDPERRRFVLARDHFGIEPLYYAVEADGAVHFCSSLRHLRARGGDAADLDPTALIRYLLLKYNPAPDTLFRGLRKLHPGHALELDAGRTREERYWRLSYRDPFDRSEAEHAERLSGLIRDAVRARLDPDAGRAGAYLSGGMDSSSVVSAMASALDEPVHAYSFRCRGESFDESDYARAVSRHWGAKYHEVPFEADAAALIADLVALQQEPLSDVGIEVSTYVLAREARGTVDYVLTGDGGDELFAGHPVYLADRMARWYRFVPGLVRRPLSAALQLLPDREQKKSLLIKAQRFAYSFEFPEDLHSNRWRISYKPAELDRLLTPEWRSAASEGPDPLRPLREVYAEVDGPDFLSRTLYGDYYTVVDFYLRRMEVVRRLGFTARFPLLDHRLVEYAARIPSHMKIASDRATKHLLQAAMSDLLPPEVANRKDKLGNSVPLKNWLRESSELGEFVLDVLSPEALRRRGIVDPAYVRRMWERHLSGRENNSHRIWSLVVLELWLREHHDTPLAGKPLMAAGHHG